MFERVDLYPDQRSGILVIMATSSLTIPLTEDVQDYIEARVDSGAYGTPADYVNDLIRKERALLSDLEQNLLRAMDGPFVELTDDEWEHGDIMAIADDRFSKQP